MRTYKQSVLLAIASSAAAIKGHFGDVTIDLHSVGEGERCNLWWNDIYLPCADPLKCVNQGPTSPNADTFGGYGICEDPEKLGDYFDLCDTDWNGERLEGCLDEFECREFEWFGI